MSNFDSDSPSENEWDERGDLAWNEFDWERYLREQDGIIHSYLTFYEELKDSSSRIDEVAKLMGWDDSDWSSEEDLDDDELDDEDDDEIDPSDREVYTLHKNPIFIATKAIYLGLKRDWELIAAHPARVPQPLALGYLASVHRGEEMAVNAIHALDFGDYAMAVSLFKRALSILNGSLALLNEAASLPHPTVKSYHEEAMRRLFDLREIWLRVITECREELNRPMDEGN